MLSQDTLDCLTKVLGDAGYRIVKSHHIRSLAIEGMATNTDLLSVHIKDAIKSDMVHRLAMSLIDIVTITSEETEHHTKYRATVTVISPRVEQL